MAELRGKSNNKVYRALELLGSGGEGSVYSIVGDPARVMKIYHDPKPDLISKITRMVDSDLKHSIDVSFPEELIFEGNRFRGYVMKRVKGDSFSSVYATSTKARAVPQDVRFTIAKNLCIALSNVHEAGFVFGDFNPANIRVDVKRRTVTLMDTDSFVFDRYGGKVARPEVVPLEIRTAMRRNESVPEDRKADLPFTKESDTYTLAVHLFRLLMNGEHPFTFKPTRPLSHHPMYAYELDPPTFPYIRNDLGLAPPPHGIPLESIPMGLQSLFVRMFREGYSDPSIRPSIRDFMEEIDSYEKDSVKCRSNSAHRYHPSLGTCPFCEASNRHAQALRGNVPETVRVSDLEYILNMDYDFIVEHPDKLPMLKRKATSGSSESQLVLGMLYSDGVLEEQNDRKAAELFLKAASSKRPSAEAQYRLGLCFLDGIGVQVSKPDAVKWLTRASGSGYAPATQLLDYVGTLEPVAPLRTGKVLVVKEEPPVEPDEPPVPQTQTVKRTRRSPHQKCMDDVVQGDRSALRRLYGFIKDGKIDWHSNPQLHQPFRDAADSDPEYAYLYHQVMDHVSDTATAERYLLQAANGGHVPAMLSVARRCHLVSDTDGARNWYSRAKALDDTVLIPEELIVEPVPEKQNRIRGGVSMFIDRIRGIWGRHRS